MSDTLAPYAAQSYPQGDALERLTRLVGEELRDTQSDLKEIARNTNETRVKIASIEEKVSGLAQLTLAVDKLRAEMTDFSSRLSLLETEARRRSAGTDRWTMLLLTVVGGVITYVADHFTRLH